MGEKWGYFLLFDAIIAHRCATMRYDSASPKTGAWPSLVAIIMVVIIMVAILLGGGNPTDVDSLPPFGSDGGYFSTYFCDIFDIYYFSTYFSDNFDIYDILGWGTNCPEDILPWGTNCPDLLGDILPWRHFALTFLGQPWLQVTSWGTFCPDQLGDILPWLLGGRFALETFCPDMFCRDYLLLKGYTAATRVVYLYCRN